jgi:hypothetical protein
MATEEVAFKITTDTSQTEKAVKSIKTELREATQEALNLSRKFGDTSKEAIEAQQKVANLRDEVGDFKDRVDALNPDAKFKAFSQTLQGVAGGFAGVQGAIGLFGTESAELEKQLLKVQSALALSEGLNSVLESKDAFTNLAVVIKKNVITAFTTLKGAIIATGIGAAVVAIGLLIANFDAVKKVVLNFIPGLAKVGEFIGKLVEQVTDFVGATSEASRAYDKLAGSNKTANEAIQRRIDLLKAQGGKESEIANLSKQLADNDLNVLRAKYKSEKGLRGEDLKNFEDLKNQKKVIDAEETARLKTEEEKRVADRKAIREKEIADKKAKDEAELLRIGGLRVAAYEKEQQEIKDKEAKRLGLIKELDNENDAFLKASSEKKIGFDLLTQAKQTSINAETYAKFEENAKFDLEIKTKAAQAEIELLTAVSSTAGQLADLAGKETAAGKALAVAQALINTYLGISAGVKLGFPAAIPAVLAASVTGFKAVKSIMSVKVPGGGGGGSIPGGGSPQSFSTASAQAPIQSGINVTQTQALGTSNVNIQNQQAIKAFVVETDITDSQDRINKIKAAATI